MDWQVSGNFWKWDLKFFCATYTEFVLSNANIQNDFLTATVFGTLTVNGGIDAT